MTPRTLQIRSFVTPAGRRAGPSVFIELVITELIVASAYRGAGL